MSENPLKQYFRQPALHLELPSGYKYYPEELIDVPPTGELPIYPMTAVDEITYKTPDALFNGSAIPTVIKSCVPAIKDPWEVLTIDLNAILAAIRIASFGNELEIEATCPKCEDTSQYGIDLHSVVDKKIDMTLYQEPLTLGDLKIHFRPITYKEVNENNIIAFEEQRLTTIVADDSIPDEQKVDLLSEAFKTLAQTSISILSKSIKSIETEETVVTDKEFINEFLANAESEVYNKVRDMVQAQRELEDLDDVNIKCPECGHEYSHPFMLDMTTFFDYGS